MRLNIPNLFKYLIIGIFLILSTSLNGKVIEDEKQTQLTTTLKLISAMSDTVHSLQQERGASSGYISSKGKRFKKTLIKIKNNTDKQIIILNNILKIKYKILKKYITKNEYNTLLNTKYNLDIVRKDVIEQKINFPKTYSRYTQIIALILLNISDIAEEIKNPKLSDALYKYSILLMYKESIGQKRAELSSLFSKHKFDKEVFEYFLTSDTQETIYIKSFFHNIDKKTKKLYDDTMNNKIVKKEAKYEQLAHEKLSGKVVDVDPEKWFSIVTQKINLIQKVEYSIFNNIVKLVHQIDIDSLIKFTTKEKDWLDNNPIIKIAVMKYWKSDKYGNNLHTDLLKLLNKYGNINLVSIKYDKWKDGYNDAIKGDPIYGIMNLSWSKERADKYFYYTKAYNYAPNYLIVREKNTNINKLDDLEGKTVYLKDKAITHTIVKNLNKDIKIIDISTDSQMYKLLSQKKEASAFISYSVDKKKLKKYHLKVAKVLYDKSGEVSIGVSKHCKILHSIIDKIYRRIPSVELEELRKKDYARLNSMVVLTSKELKWLLKNQKITYVYDPCREPFEYKNDLEIHSGVSAKILELVTKRSSLQFKAINTKDWKESVEAIENHKADMFCFIIENQKRDEYLNFTKRVLFKVPVVLVTNIKDTKIYENIKFDLKNKTIGVVEGRGIYKMLAKKYPYFHFVMVKSVEEGFKKVSDGQIDMFAINKSTAKYYNTVKDYDKVKIATTTDINLNFKMALQKDLPPEVLSILNKTLNSISEQELNDIYNSVVNVKVKKSIDWWILEKIGMIIVVIILFILWNNRKLHKVVDEKTRDLKEVLENLEKTVDSRTKELNEEKHFIDTILNSQENFVITTDGKALKTANKSFLKFFNVRDVDDFSNKYGGCVCEIFEEDRSDKYIKKSIYGKSWLTYINDRPHRIHKTIIKRDGKDYIFTVASEKLFIKGQNLKTVIFTDITQLEENLSKIEAIHKHTRDSIEYASLIQGALIPSEKALSSFFKDYFATWTPKDTVGGDIWLCEQLRHEDECLLFVIDCTGHGVPGAFVTMIVKSVEREITAIIKANKTMDVSPAWVMSYFNKTIKKLLRQETIDSLSNAGFDGGIIYYNRRTQTLKFSGAETSLFYVDENGEFNTIKGSRYSVGYKKCKMDYKYKEDIINVKEGMKFYCTTDGYLDQNGGEKGFPFGKKRFSNIIKEHYQENMNEIKNILKLELNRWEEKIPNTDRNDDITLIGFEINEKSECLEFIIEEIIKYEGVITQNVIASCMDNIEYKISDMGLMGNISTITIEYCQNMMNYSKNEEKGSRQIVPAGTIDVHFIDNSYYEITSINIVSKDDKERIEPKLIEIQSLDKQGIKKRYRELRKSGQNTHSKGGGIGMYEIAKVSDKIEYEFTPINEDKYYFTMRSIVNTKKDKEKEK